MVQFLIDLLNVCLIPFQRTDNLIIFVATSCLVISMLFMLVNRLMKGR